jgi:hypothetical protein
LVVGKRLAVNVSCFLAVPENFSEKREVSDFPGSYRKADKTGMVTCP